MSAPEWYWNLNVPASVATAQDGEGIAVGVGYRVADVGSDKFFEEVFEVH